MENPSKLIGGILGLIGIGVCLWRAIAGNPAGAIGVAIGILGRLISEYEWFG